MTESGLWPPTGARLAALPNLAIRVTAASRTVEQLVSRL